MHSTWVHIYDLLLIIVNILHDEITLVFIYNMKISDLVSEIVMAFLQSTIEIAVW